MRRMRGDHVGADKNTVLADRYVLGDVLGRGGMADVYRATDRLLGRQVAVKLLRDTAGDESDRRRFTAEARTLAGLSNPGLVMVLDAGATAEQPFLVMELVEGSTVAQLCADGPVNIERVGSIGVQVAEALAYVHGHGVVHRDVKPGNILIGAGDRVKLADFGIARILGDTVRHTKTGLAIGTAAYLAPEQVRGNDIGAAADVYSLGLVLLEALTGERSYPGALTESALARLARGPHIPDTLPVAWCSLLTQMTALDPAQRPTASSVAAQLRTLPSGPHRVSKSPAPDTETISFATVHGTPSTPPSTRTAARAPGADHTRLMSQPVEVTRPAGTTAEQTMPPGPSIIDTTRDAPARRPQAMRSRLSPMPPHLRGAAAAVVALVLLVTVVVIASQQSSGSGDELPSQTPPNLERPLQDLHDAINGG